MCQVGLLFHVKNIRRNQNNIGKMFRQYSTDSYSRYDDFGVAVWQVVLWQVFTDLLMVARAGGG